MFADDVASFSNTIIRLQHQINYKERLDLCVYVHLNLLKTKKIVLMNGGVLKQTDKWFYMREVVDVVSFYKYLQISFTSKLIRSMTKDVVKLFSKSSNISIKLVNFAQKIFSNYLTPYLSQFSVMASKFGATNTVKN